MHEALARLTVVVPVGPGDAVSPALQAQLTTLAREAEVVVVEADTARVAPPPTSHPPDGLHWQSIAATPGRAAQQNAGAAAATRDWLWFLHADSRLASMTLPALARFVQRDEAALGYFELRFLDDGPAMMPLNALGTRLRSAWLGLPFGDQGLVLSRRVFDQLGGFDTALTRGEDHDLVWRARRAGVVLRGVGAPLYTSARRYAERGWWTMTSDHLQETWRQACQFSRVEGMPRKQSGDAP